MKRSLRWALAAAVLLALPVNDAAWARGGGHGHHGHHGHRGVHIGVLIGVPLLLHHWWGHQAYAAPPAPTVVPAEPVYAIRDEPPATAYWYRCLAPDGYYPYVQECPGGWQREVPRAPPR